jgi:hypothetical protein
LIEIEEALDALEAAIEYKNESIHSRKEDLRKSAMYSSVSIRPIKQRNSSAEAF